MKRRMIPVILGVMTVCICACGKQTSSGSADSSSADQSVTSSSVSNSSVKKTADVSVDSTDGTSQNGDMNTLSNSTHVDEKKLENKSTVDYTPYQELIAKISDSVAKVLNGEEYDQEEMTRMTNSFQQFAIGVHENHDNTNYGYFMQDLDGDGIDELLIGFSDSYVWEVYTIQNDELVNVYLTAWRGGLQLCTNGKIETSASGAQLYSAWTYSEFQNGALNPIETVFTKCEENDFSAHHWYYSEGDGSNQDLSTEISESEGEAIKAKYPHQQMNFTLF